MRALRWVLVASTISGCIIEPPDMVKDGGTPDAAVPPDVQFDGGGPIQLPDGGFNWDGGWNGGGGGGGGGGGTWDGGFPDSGTVTPPTFPGSGQNGDRGTGVLWLVRIDRGTANLAASYAPLIRGMTQQLAAQGFDVRVTGVGSLYEPSVFWATSGKELSTSEIQGVLEKAANERSTTPSACSTAALAELGGQLSAVEVWPGYGTSGEHWPYTNPLSNLLVVLLDHGARPVAYSASACATSGWDAATWFGGLRDNTRWLNRTSSTWNVPRAQTRFLFISTPENETYAQMRERCAAMSTFPRNGLDALSPSSVAFYEPFNEGLGRYQAGLGSRLDVCEAVARDWTGYSRDFARKWAQWLNQPEAQR
ncbi:hypothetical protein [Melittangium boletus]|uniref:Lipoprotein n=1 Tax=Melittangium boletus DSM 14713 TaxID=1294270 RepID=A0A250ICB4_9BACT|nr:hypothetical protein [Melittangium boletus]ATB28812.1 hypothetical protein MEBOL_002261 [Melittangium boletus DSM 14713]